MHAPVVQKHDQFIQRGVTVALLTLAGMLVGVALVLYV